MQDESRTVRLRAKKSLGQHFLNSPVVLKQIIESAHIQKGENILEIGPGTGVLTKALLEAGAHVIAIEKDARAIGVLRRRFTNELGSREKEAGRMGSPRLTLICGDILNMPSSFLLPASFSIVANIPYYITGAILELFLEHEPRPSRMVLLVQKEVAERVTAKPEGNEILGKESILSISVKAFGTPKMIAWVPRGAFTPPPAVDSAVLLIENISAERFATASKSGDADANEKNADIQRFFKIVKAGFAHKRKILKRNLEAVIETETIKKVWLELKLSEKARAEDIALETWFEIAKRA